jgi:DNA modification methylase
VAVARKEQRRQHGGPRRRARREHAESRLLQGECVEVMAALEAASVDAVITDPPYGIGFKHEHWDSWAISEAAARAGHDRLTPNQAFEVWCRLWGSECLRIMKPGSHLLAFGSPRTFHRLTVGLEDAGLEIRDTLMWLYGTGMPKSRRLANGRGTALKPAYEPIVLARKPPEGSVAESIEHFGTGALEVDACRIGERWPANLALGHAPGCGDGGCGEDCAVDLLDASARSSRASSGAAVPPSRFFYCPKVSRAERDAGCEQLPRRALDLFPNAQRDERQAGGARNPHPTVKPLALMRWLVRLASPPSGLVLDPTCGSGTTGAASVLEGRRFIGIELDPAYVEIAAARIAHWAPSGTGAPKVRRASAERSR